MASKLLTGIALGLVAGLLLAPDKGSATREKLARKGKDLKNKFNDFVDTLHEKFNAVKEDVEEEAVELRNTARSFSSERNGAWGS
jgi:gas vesicle protein